MLEALKANQFDGSLSAEELEEVDGFQELLKGWAETSHEILRVLQEKDPKVFKNLNPRQLMAMGALQAHLTLSMQAKMAIDKDS